MSTCKGCQEPIEQPNQGRRRIWCSDRCRKAHNAIPAAPRGENSEPVAPAVIALIDALNLADNDPRSVVGLLAVLTARELDEQPGNVPLIRELRQSLVQLTGGAVMNALGEVDEERIRLLSHRITSGLGGGRRRDA